MDYILDKSRKLLDRLENIGKFESKYNAFPHKEATRIIEEMSELAKSLPDIKIPKNKNQLIQTELKRRLKGEVFSLEGRIKSAFYDFNSIVSMYSIPRLDIDNLKGWLISNKERVSGVIEKLYKTRDVKDYELNPLLDVPSVRQKAEEFSMNYIQKYHRKLGKLLQDLTQAGEFLKKINAVPTTNPRSYFEGITKTLAIGMQNICFTTKEGHLKIKERNLIELYGHEGMGHALNEVITGEEKIHYFLTKKSPIVLATMESVAQFYQEIIFEDLKNSPKTQKELGIDHKFKEIYQETKDITQINKYDLKFFQYGITVLADKSLGNPQDKSTLKKKIEILNEVAIDPTKSINFIEKNKYNFDHEGNLNPQLIFELIYCAQPVQRALTEFAKQGILYESKDRGKIDMAFLKGFWTPIGFVDNARLIAKGKV